MERQSKESRGLEAYCRGGQGPPRAVAPSGGGEVSQILEILNNNFKPNFVQKFSIIEAYNALAHHFVYVEAKFGTLDKRIKKRLTSFEMKFFGRTAGYALFDLKNN